MLNKELLLTASTSESPQLVINVVNKLYTPTKVQTFEYSNIIEKPYVDTIGSVQEIGIYYFDMPPVPLPDTSVYRVIAPDFRTTMVAVLVNAEVWNTPPNYNIKVIRVVDKTKDAYVELHLASGGGGAI